MKLALVWGHNYEDKFATTHHTFWEATLRDRGIEFDRFSWTDWQTQLKPGYDLYFFIDFNPALYKLRHYPQLHPRCFYWWDSFHHPFTYVAQIVEMFDRSYFAEYQTTKGLQNQGLTTVKWLPPSFYENLFRPLKLAKDLDFAFIGQPDNTVVLNGQTRKEFVEGLIERYKGVIEQGMYGEKVNELYSRSKILFDRTIYCNVGTRVFETIGSGAFVLANRSKIYTGLDELAIDGHHYVSYRTRDDFIDKFDYYLGHQEERERIAKAGHEHFLRNHTYSHRLDVILKDFGLI